MSCEGEARRVPDVLLERYRLGELDTAEREQLQRQLARDEGLRRRLEEIERSEVEIRKRYPPEWLAERVRDRLGQAARPGAPRRAAWTLHWPVPAAVAVAAVVLLVLAPRIAGPPAPVPGVGASLGPADRIKGLPSALALYRRTAAGSEVLVEGSVAHVGDLIRVGYRSAGRSFGVILSIDGRGAVTLHLPAAGGQAAAPLRAGDVVLLDHAYELDDAPRWECFYLVTSEAPFAVAPVLEAARRAAATAAAGGPPKLLLPPSLGQSSLSLRKGERP